MLYNLLNLIIGVAIGTLLGSEIMWRRMLKKIKKFIKSDEFKELVQELAIGVRLALATKKTALPVLEVMDCGEGEGGEGGIQEA